MAVVFYSLHDGTLNVSVLPSARELRQSTDKFPKEYFIESRQKALLVAQAVLNKQAEDVLVMDLRPVSNASDFFVLATATSHRQVLAISEQVEQELKQAGGRVWYVEGLRSESRWREHPAHELSWILMDCGDVVVHVFNAPARDFYQLERLWADAPRVSLTEPFDP